MPDLDGVWAELKRIKTGGEMASEKLREQVVKHIDEAYAMEQNVLRMLDSMIGTTEDPEIKDELRKHKLETERHADRMRQRLEAHGASPSFVREAGGIAGALMKSVLDKARGERHQNVAVELALLLGRGHAGRVEILDLGRHPHRILAGVESANPVDPAHAGQSGAPGLRCAVAQRCDGP